MSKIHYTVVKQVRPKHYKPFIVMEHRMVRDYESQRPLDRFRSHEAADLYMSMMEKSND